jgi:hypothetical protein
MIGRREKLDLIETVHNSSIPVIWTFLAGFLGSAAVEIVAMDELLHKDAPLPARYRRKSFWPIRFFLACMGGALAVYYNIENPMAAFQIGASAPAIIKSLAKLSRR